MTEESESTVLWRPVGQAELELIEQSGWRAFPAAGASAHLLSRAERGIRGADRARLEREGHMRLRGIRDALLRSKRLPGPVSDRDGGRVGGTRSTGFPRRRWTPSTRPSWGRSKWWRSSAGRARDAGGEGRAADRLARAPRGGQQRRGDEQGERHPHLPRRHGRPVGQLRPAGAGDRAGFRADPRRVWSWYAWRRERIADARPPRPPRARPAAGAGAARSPW